MTKVIKVLVVDDSAFMRMVLTDIVNSCDEFNVAGTAKNGLEALEMTRSLQPDVITLDVEMPTMDGISCLKELMKITDVPVIMLSGHTKSGESATIEALEAGAIDFITKPAMLFEISSVKKKKEIIDKIKMAGRIHGRRRLAGKAETVIPVEHKEVKEHQKNKLKTLVAIGASTGGPKALQQVVPYIPEDVPAALIIVQHMPPGFTKSLADRLNMISELTVKEGENGEVIKPGYAYIAPGDSHMEVHGTDGGILKIRLTKNAPAGGHRPSINVMMNSIAKTRFPSVIAVIMTGMGNDGEEGIVNIKQSNRGRIISQDEQSCVVYGMPKSAVGTGVVDAVVPLKEIAGVILKYMGVDH